MKNKIKQKIMNAKREAHMKNNNLKMEIFNNNLRTNYKTILLRKKKVM